MDKTVITNALRNTKTNLIKHSPQILTGVGIVGMIGTTVMAVKATPKAIKIIDEKRVEKCDELTPVEVIKATWKCYIPSAITGVASVGCLIRANSISTRRNAALVTAYNLSRNALAEYKEKVVETIGEKKEQAVVDKIAKDKIEKDPVSNHEVIKLTKGTTLCYDAVFGRYFMSDIETIRRAVNKINRSIVSDMYASLNDFYSEIGLPHVDVGELLGWNYDDGEVEIFFSSDLSEDGTPCLVIHYNVVPKYDFSKLY